MTFKDLKKRITAAINNRTQSFDKLQNKPFGSGTLKSTRWKMSGQKENARFNHIIGLPTKEGLEKPIFDYQELLHEENSIF